MRQSTKTACKILSKDKEALADLAKGMLGIEGFPEEFKCKCGKVNEFKVGFEKSSYDFSGKFGTLVVTCSCGAKYFYEGICRHTDVYTISHGEDGWEKVCRDCGKLVDED